MRLLPLQTICLVLLFAAVGCGEPEGPTVQLNLGKILGDDSATAMQGFARALVVREFRFPEDHGPHPEYKHEWWYLTGNLTGEEGNEFGYQVTFFRIALAPPEDNGQPPRRSHWATRQVWMAHVAITDVAAKKHIHSQRLSRDALGLAGISTRPFRIWLDDWRITGTGPDFPWRLQLRDADLELDLEVSPIRDPVLQGDRGLSHKSSAPGNASYYYSITRLQTTGSLRVADRRHTVQGLSWLDREWSTSALGPDQAGWDWFSLQLDSGEDLMYYQLRGRDGSIDPLSAGTWLQAGNRKQSLAPADIALEALDYWQSPYGQRYPVRWRLRLRNQGRDWIVTAPVPDQLMDTLVRYWEGTVDVIDASTGHRVGRGYLEMTGY